MQTTLPVLNKKMLAMLPTVALLLGSLYQVAMGAL